MAIIFLKNSDIALHGTEYLTYLFKVIWVEYLFMYLSVLDQDTDDQELDNNSLESLLNTQQWGSQVF